MSDSFLTEAEVESLKDLKLHRKTPYLIRGVSQTQFSIARHYGGTNFNGDSFTYCPETDECIRDDVHAKIMKDRRAAEKAAKLKATEVPSPIKNHPTLF